MPRADADQIWAEDVQDGFELSENAWKVVYSWIYKIQRYAESLPDAASREQYMAVVNRLTPINNNLAEATKKLKELYSEGIFPPMPP